MLDIYEKWENTFLSNKVLRKNGVEKNPYHDLKKDLFLPKCFFYSLEIKQSQNLIAVKRQTIYGNVST